LVLTGAILCSAIKNERVPIVSDKEFKEQMIFSKSSFKRLIREVASLKNQLVDLERENGYLKSETLMLRRQITLLQRKHQIELHRAMANSRNDDVQWEEVSVLDNATSETK